MDKADNLTVEVRIVDEPLLKYWGKPAKVGNVLWVPRPTVCLWRDLSNFRRSDGTSDFDVRAR